MIFQNCPKYLENFEILRAGIIAKYYVQVLLLFVYDRSREIFGNTQETFLFTVEKKNKHRRQPFTSWLSVNNVYGKGIRSNTQP